MTAGGKGWNFGWARYEGSRLYKARAKTRGFAWPVTQINHPEAESMTGGYVYRGTAYPTMQGVYYFGDFVLGKIWGLQNSGGVWVRALLVDTPYMISTFGTDENGDLWFADYAGGRIYKLGTL